MEALSIYWLLVTTNNWRQKMKILDSKSLAKILSNRWTILEALYPDYKITLMDLSAKTGIEIGNLSKQVNGSQGILGLLETRLPDGETLISVKEEIGKRGVGRQMAGSGKVRRLRL